MYRHFYPPGPRRAGAMPSRARIDPMSPPATGGTRGSAKDGSIEVKTQAVILYWKQVANGSLKMAAYDFAAAETNQSASHVRKLVADEEAGGVDKLASRRDNCGPITDFSPGKKAKLEQVMEETDWEPTQRQCQEALGLGSHNTAAKWIEMSEFDKMQKRTITLLTPAHMQARVKYCEDHFEDDYQSCAHGDEKLFVLGVGRKWRYVRREEKDMPCLKFVQNKLHPPQLMVTAIVAPPLPAKGFDGKVSLFMSHAGWSKAVYTTKNRAKGTDLISTDSKVKGCYESVSGEVYKERMVSIGFPAIQESGRIMGIKQMRYQDDNATPHQKAWEKLGLDQAAKKFNIKREPQPARSPDLNVVDLYVWRVLEAGVNRRRPGTLEELWEALLEAWNEDLTEAKLECAFRLLHPVMALINSHNGGNNFKLPHTGIRKAMREDGWEI